MTTLRAATLPYRKPELGKHYWIKDNILPDAFPVVERCLNKTEWTMGAPCVPSPGPACARPTRCFLKSWPLSKIG